MRVVDGVKNENMHFQTPVLSLTAMCRGAVICDEIDAKSMNDSVMNRRTGNIRNTTTKPRHSSYTEQ